MDVMERRRALMMMPRGLDTSPRIADYTKVWGREVEKISDSTTWCITEWYRFDPQKSGQVTIVGYIGNDGNQYTFQYHNESESFKDWFYFNNGNQEGRRQIRGSANDTVLYEISFSIYQAVLDDSYAYVNETGQIFFAGKNTQYYGHRNISELN